MVIESFNFSEVGYYTRGTYVEVFSFDLLFKKPFETQYQSQDIKLHTSAESTLIGIRYSPSYSPGYNNYYAGTSHRNKYHPCQLEFNCGKSWKRVEIITANVKQSTYSPVQKIQNVDRNDWYAFDKISFKEKDEELDGLHLFVEFNCYSSVDTKLIKTLDELLISELFSDVVIVSSDGRNFNVHKSIISCNSEVFKAHFLHETEENTTGKIMSVFDAEVITELLGYMYSERVNNMGSVSERLLAAADFYKLYDLKGQCEVYLSNNITIDNAIDIYKLADLHSAPCLKKKCMRFIQIHRKKILESTAWSEFKPSALMKELCHFLLQI